MLTLEQRAHFSERGFLRLRAVFSCAEATAMEERIWERLERKHGVRREEPGSWKIPLASGLQPLRSEAVFDPIGGPGLRAALDELIGEGRWALPKHWGQFLVNFPRREESGKPSTPLWHTDFPYFLPADRVVGALVFSFLAAVPARCGGTLVIAGSHRVVGHFVAGHPHLRKAKMKVARSALMKSDPWLQQLGSEPDPGEGASGSWDAAAGVPVQVVELTGEPGDVVIGHPWLLHSPSPNRGDRPRFMRVQRIRPATRKPD